MIHSGRRSCSNDIIFCHVAPANYFYLRLGDGEFRQYIEIPQNVLKSTPRSYLDILLPFTDDLHAILIKFQPARSTISKPVCSNLS